MTEIIRRKAFTGVFCLTAALLGTSQAWGSGFALREQSAEGLGNAFAGQTAKANTVATVYYNPAGMTRLDGNQTGGVTTYIMPTATFDGHASLAGSRISGQSGMDAIMDAAIGSVYAMWEVNPDLKLGMAVTTPYGLRSHYPSDWVGRYHALTSNITTVNASPSVAYRINDHLSVGAGIQIAYTRATLSNAINLNAITMGLVSRDGKTSLQGDDLGFGGDLGLLWEASPATRVGLNYRSQVNHTLTGTIRFEGIPTALQSNAAFKNGHIKADLTTPDSISAGLYHEISPAWAVMSDVQWTRWSSLKELRVRYDDGRADSVTFFNWKDTWFLSLGATYTMPSAGQVHVGVAYDQSAVSGAYRGARVPDSNRYWISAGYGYAFDEGPSLYLGYAHLFADKATINESSVSGSGFLTGTYDSSVDIISTSLTLAF